jgi:uncharacterized membrane protein HdeD (DUF308 family)
LDRSDHLKVKGLGAGGHGYSSRDTLVSGHALGGIMIILGVILLLLGWLLKITLLYYVGAILLVIGLVLLVLGSVGRPLAGRRHYW